MRVDNFVAEESTLTASAPPDPQPRDLRSKWPVLFLIWLMMLVAYFDRVDVSVAGPTISQALHLTKTQFGLVLSAFTLGYAVMQVPGGHLADKFGSRRLLVIALLVWSLFTGLTGVAISLASLLTIRVLFGIGEGIENGAQFKLIGDYFDSRERSRANAIFLTALALGPAVATPLTTWLLPLVGWRNLFFCFGGLGLVVAGLLAAFLPHDASVSRQAEAKSDWKQRLGEALGHPAIWLCFAAYLLFNATFWGFLGWIPTYLKDERHLTLAKMGVLGALPYLGGFVGMLLIGQLGSSYLAGRRPALVAGCYAAGAVFLYVAPTASQTAACVAGLTLAAFFLYGGFGPFWAISIGLTSPETRGAFTGFVNFGGQIGGFVAQIVIGWLADQNKSFHGAILFMIATLALAAVAMAVLQALPANRPATAPR